MRHENEDYSLLEGREIDYVESDGTITKGVVTGCDYDIGITIQGKDDTDGYLLCLVGPSAPNHNKAERRYMEKHKVRFYSYVRQIKRGVFSCAIDNRIEHAFGVGGFATMFSSDPTVDDCAFTQ